MNVRATLYDAVDAYPGGIEAMAARVLGRDGEPIAVSTLYGILNGQERHSLTLERFDVIMRALYEAKVDGPADRVMHSMCFKYGGLFLRPPKADSSPQDLVQAMLAAVKEFGDLASASAERIADGDVSKKDLDVVEREGYEAIVKIVAYLEACRAAHAA